MPIQGPQLIIRADGGAEIGSGHIMRSLALALAWQQRGGRVTFLSHCDSEALLQRIRAERMDVIPIPALHPAPVDLETTLQTLAKHDATWLVTDGYHLDEAYQQAIRAHGHRLLVIDDNAHLPAYHADVLLNQNVYAGKLDYTFGPDTVPLLGTRYALLRPEFLQWRARPRLIPAVAKRILVTLGGSDPDNTTLRVIEALKRLDIPGVQARIVVGHANPHRALLDEALLGTRGNLKLLSRVQDMPALMDWADVAVSAGGSTCWELAFMGLPCILLVLAENQRRIAAELDHLGAAWDLGRHSDNSVADIGEELTSLMVAEETRRAMSLSLRQLVDGEGASRVVAHLQTGQAPVSVAA